MDINEDLLECFTNVLIKSVVTCTGTNINSYSDSVNQQLHNPTITKFEKHQVYYFFKYNIWGANLADMQLISKYNRGIQFLLCVMDIFSKYVWVAPLKDKKGIKITNAFQTTLGQSCLRQAKYYV